MYVILLILYDDLLRLITITYCLTFFGFFKNPFLDDAYVIRAIYIMPNLKISLILFSGHTVNKTWVDPTVTSKRQAFLDGFSAGAKNPTSKGRRLIVVHIGNEDGSVEGASWIFESKGSGNYHESMDAVHFEKWFKEVLPKLGDNAVVVMDNAPYHSRRQEKVPN